MAEIHEFFNALHAGNEIRARQLLALAKLDPNAVDPGKQLSWRERLSGRSTDNDGSASMDGFNALHIAVRYGHVELARDLISRGADVNRRTMGLTPIHLARSAATVALLAEQGADLNAGITERRADGRLGVGSTALHHAAVDGYDQDVVKELLDRGADPNIANKDGLAPLHLAASTNARIYEQLIASGARDGAGTEDKQSPAVISQALAPAAGQPVPEQPDTAAAGQPAREEPQTDEEKNAEKSNEIEAAESDEVREPGATIDPLGAGAGSEPVRKAVLTKGGFVLPKVIKDLYVEVDGRYVDRRTEQVSFEDEGKKLTTESNDRKVIEHMIAVAHAKGWASFTATGSKEFLREAWIAGQVMGMTVKSAYEPTKEDIAAALARKEEMRIDAGKDAPTRERDEKGGGIEHAASPERQRSTQPGQSAAPAQPAQDQQRLDREPARPTEQQPAQEQANAPKPEQLTSAHDEPRTWTQEEWDQIRSNKTRELREDQAQREAEERAIELDRLSKSPLARENLAREILARAGLDPKQLLAADGAVKDEGRMTPEKFDALAAARSEKGRPQSPDTTPAPPLVAPAVGLPEAKQPSFPAPAGLPTHDQKPASPEPSVPEVGQREPDAPANGNDAREAALRVVLETKMEEIGVPAAQRDELRGQLTHNIAEVQKSGIALDVPEPLTMNAMPAIEHQKTHEPNMGKDAGHEISR